MLKVKPETSARFVLLVMHCLLGSCVMLGSCYSCVIDSYVSDSVICVNNLVTHKDVPDTHQALLACTCRYFQIRCQDLHGFKGFTNLYAKVLASTCT